MHITICSTSYPPSIWNAIGMTTYSIAQGLSALGHQVTVVTYNPACGDKFAKDKLVRIQYIGTDGQSTLAIEQISIWQEKVAAFLKEYSRNTELFICIDSYGFKGIVLSGLQRKTIGICNFIYSAVGWLQSIGAEFETRLLAEEVEFFRAVDILLVNNAIAAQKIQALIGRTPDRYKIGIREIKGYKHTPKKNTVLYVGKLNREKGIERILRVMPFVEWMRLTICDQNASNTYRLSVAKLIDELGIDRSRISYTDFLSTQQVWQLYTESEICVIPHIAEPFGYAAIYPMMLGTPTLVSTAHSLPEIIGNEDAGAVFKNLEELSFFLDEVHHLPMLSELYSINARKRVLEEYSFTRMIESISKHF